MWPILKKNQPHIFPLCSLSLTYIHLCTNTYADTASNRVLHSTRFMITHETFVYKAVVTYPLPSHSISSSASELITENQKNNFIINMKFFICFALLFAVAVAAPAANQADAEATIIEQNSDIDPEGNFQYS